MTTPGTVEFPAALDDTTSLIDATNRASSTLSAQLTAGATTASLTNASGFPTSGSFTCENEIIYYTGKSTNDLTGLIRGREGTTDATHVIGTTVEGRITARHVTVVKDALRAVEAKVGTGSSTPAANQLFAGTGTGVSAWTSNPTLGGTLVSNSGTWGRGLEDLRGDQLGYAAVGGNLTPGLWADLRVGTSGSPVTGASGKGGIIKISKTEDLRVADFVGGSTNEQSAGLVIHTKNAATSEVQCAGVYVVAETLSTSATGGANKDAMGAAFTGRVTGSGTGYGIGAYAVGRRDNTTGKINGLEVRAWNESANDITYNSAGASNGMGIWLSTSGPSGAVNRKCGVGIQIGKATDGIWDVGIGIAPIGGISPIATTTFQDDCASTNGIIINGAKTCAIGVAAGAGPLQVGRTASLINAGALIEAYKNGGATGLISAQGQNATDLISFKVGNGAGSSRWFTAGATNDEITGAVQGDSGLAFTTTKAFHIGRFGNAPLISVGANAQGLGFFGTAPVIKSTNAITLTNYTVGARSLDRNSFTLNQLADVVCELVRQIGDTVGVGLVNDA